MLKYLTGFSNLSSDSYRYNSVRRFRDSVTKVVCHIHSRCNSIYVRTCIFQLVQELYFASYRSESMGNRSVVLQLKEIGPSLMPMDRYYTVYFYHYLAHTRMLSFSRNKLSKDTTMKSGM